MRPCGACGRPSERLTFTPPDPRWLCRECRECHWPGLARSTTGTSYVAGAARLVAGRDCPVVKRNLY